MNKILALLTTLLLAPPALAAGPSGGPGPVPSPWLLSGNTVYYSNGGVTVPFAVPGGSLGIGTINVTGGYYVNGVSILGIPCAECALINKTNVFTFAQVVNLNTSFAPTALTGTLLDVSQADAQVARVQTTSYGTLGEFAGVQYGGTNATKTAVASGTEMARFAAYGYNGSGVVGPIAVLHAFASETLASGHQGSALCMATTTIGGTTLADGLCQQNNGGVTVGLNGSSGVGTINVASGYFINGTNITAATQTLTNKSISGSANTLTNIPNSALTNSTISGTALGGTLPTLTFGTYLTGTSYNGTGAISLATNATNAATASTLVARDASGNFSAGTITAALTGHASSDLALTGGTVTGATTFSGGATIGTTFTATGLVSNADLTHSATTVNGQTCTLGATCTVTAAATGVTVGSTTVTGGTSGDIEYNNAGVLGEKAVTGSGSVVLATSPTLTGATLTSSSYNGTVTATTPIAVSSGGTACAAASGTCLDNITGFGSVGVINRSGAGSYSILSTDGSGSVVLSNSATMAGVTLTGSAFNGTIGATTPSTGVFTGVNTSAWNIDANFGAGLTSGNPFIGFNPSSFIEYDRTNNLYDVLVSGGTPLQIGASLTNSNVPFQINEPANGNTTLTINSPSDTNGANIYLIGNGSTTPTKRIRAHSGSLEIINNANTAVMLSLSDSGSGTFAAAVTGTQFNGNVPVADLNSGTGASSSTFWRGDGTWATPAGGGTVTTSGSPASGQIATFTSSSAISGVSIVPAANGGAGTVNGALAGNGAGAVSQAASTGLSDTVAPATWTPTDGSGAGLVFSPSTAVYTKIGKMVTLQFQLTYPTTVSGTNAAIQNLPAALTSLGSFTQQIVGQCIGGTSVAFVEMAPGATRVSFYNVSNVPLTNTQLSTLAWTCGLNYISN